VSLWAGLRLLKRGDRIPGYGRLLREHLTACIAPAKGLREQRRGAIRVAEGCADQSVPR
jgi:hypothetical protein